jgi:hypothetical protein
MGRAVRALLVERRWIMRLQTMTAIGTQPGADASMPMYGRAVFPGLLYDPLPEHMYGGHYPLMPGCGVQRMVAVILDLRRFGEVKIL